MTTRIKVLDHGYVALVETWGSDERIVEAARMSTQGGFKGWGPGVQCRYCGSAERQTVADHGGCAASGGDCDMGLHGPPGDEKLLKFLYTNNHATPFEMGGIIVEVQAPIFVFREWHRHRTQSYNEASARYAPLPAVDYVPTLDRTLIGADGNKQAGTVVGSATITRRVAAEWLNELVYLQTNVERHYQKGLESGVPKELARLAMTVGRYSKMRASANLRNWLGFLTLRMDSKAQWEIRQYANAVSEFVKQSFPRTHALFMDGRS
jgi:thymidylate synthase (FAD)